MHPSRYEPRQAQRAVCLHVCWRRPTTNTATSRPLRLPLQHSAVVAGVYCFFGCRNGSANGGKPDCSGVRR